MFKMRRVHSSLKVGFSALVGLGAFVPLGAIASPEPVLISQAAGDVTVYERPSYINTCRGTETQITIYADTARSRVVRQVPAYSSMTLTGVLAPGLAQIREPGVGWVETSALRTNCNPTRPDQSAGACYQVTQPELQVRATPYGTYLAVLANGTRVNAVSPPQRQTSSDGRIWLKVIYQGTSEGWVAETGVGGIGRNLVPCN